MAESYTTTKDLLVDLGRIIKIEKGSRLRSLGDVRVGVIKTPHEFPVVAIIPVTKRYLTLWNGVANVIHNIRFDVYTRKLDSKAAFNQALGIINTLKTIFKPGYNETGHQVPRQSGEASVCSTSVVDERFTEVYEYAQGLLQYAVLQMEFYSKEPIYQVDPIAEGFWKYAQAKELMEVVNETSKEYKDITLQDVQAFKVGTLPPQMSFPCVYTTTDELETNTEALTSAEVEDNIIRVLTINKLLDNEQALLDNVDITDRVQQAVASSGSSHLLRTRGNGT